MQQLSSYVCGRWQPGQGRFQSLLDPSNGEVLAQASTEGLDFGAAVRHAREQGGPALRALGFAERGKLLNRVMEVLHAGRDGFLELSRQNGGNTRSDAKFDVDGAIGTLAYYAGLGEKLGERGFLPDGESIQLGRSPRFHGQHVLVPRQGVAVHVNAFNFPAWGMFEKAACAWLAGMPVIAKPATSTALLAWRMAQAVIESGALPEGTFQLLAGSLGDLFDHLGPQDCVAFTGSAATGRKIRGHARLLDQGVRVNVEADSLNAAVLAPDLDGDSEAYRLFLTNLVLDMTQKAGQKCTAVRRVLVPAQRLEEVQADLVDALARIQVGDPGVENVRMGPVSGPDQKADVQAGLSRLAAVATRVTPDRPGLAAAGAFVSPALFVARDLRAAVVHEEEVFGPVATLLPYDGTVEQAVELVRLGGGELVTSVYSNDADWTVAFVLGAAAWNGRIWIGSDKMAEQALPPGMVLPQMIHGGPGRAGGGEELGGARGLAFYMQRVALQGFKGLLESRFGAK